MGIFLKQNIIWQKQQFFSIDIANFETFEKKPLSPNIYIYSKYYPGKNKSSIFWKLQKYYLQQYTPSIILERVSPIF